MMESRLARWVFLVAVSLLLVDAASAQQNEDQPAKPSVLTPPNSVEAKNGSGEPSQDPPGFLMPNGKRLRVRLAFMAVYGGDSAQAELGFSRQGRIGYATVTLEGELSHRVSYRVALNPIDDTRPLPACGETNYFYPNSPGVFGMGPNVPCNAEGNRRVDLYKYVAVDNLLQQGPLREGYMDLSVTRATRVRFGRFVLPIGLGWEEVGSFTSKDSTRIQRINAEADFGLMMTWAARRGGRRVGGADLATVLGDGHRNADYNYFYFEDPTLSSKATLTTFVSGSFSPLESIEVRGAFKHGFTGSKVERLPTYWASKRRDDAMVVSARYRPIRHASVFGEWARYTWGPTQTSAELLGVDAAPILKRGYYVGMDIGVPLTQHIRLGTTITREELSRDDSLVKWLASQDLYRVSLGKKDRGTIVRLQLVLDENLTIGAYRNLDSTPFPWISGIVPVAGPGAFAGPGTDKWGVVMGLRLQ